MDKLEKLVNELVDISGPRIRLGSRALDPVPGREKWERHVKSLCGQIFMQGLTAGWDKHVAVVEERERGHRNE